MHLVFLLLVPGVCVFGETLPGWFIPLREAIYEQQLTADEIASVYREISGKAKTSLSGADQYIMLSRCEYMMGRAYLFEERKEEADRHFTEGMKMAERALDIRKSAEGWQMLAENLSQACIVRSTSFVIANGLNVEKYSKNAAAIDNKNAAARIMIAARWVYAPSPFHNYKRGIEMMSAIITECNMDKDDQFNVYSGIGYAYMQQKNQAQSGEWFNKALAIYPTNKYINSLLEKKR